MAAFESANSFAEMNQKASDLTSSLHLKSANDHEAFIRLLADQMTNTYNNNVWAPQPSDSDSATSLSAGAKSHSSHSPDGKAL